MQTFQKTHAFANREPRSYLFTPSRLLWIHILFWAGAGLITTFWEDPLILLYYCLVWLFGLSITLTIWVTRTFFRPSTLISRERYPLASDEEIREQTVVMIPAYNEEESIERCVREVKRYVDRVVVINDGSTDRTAELAEKAGAIVIHNSENKGLAFTFRSGAEYAASLQNVKAIVNFDADLQYDANDIPELVSPIFTGHVDLMMGSRLAGTIESMPWIKLFGNRLFTVLLAILTGVRITDGQSGFRAFTPELINSIYLRPGFTYTQQMIIETAYRGFKIKEIPIYFATRKFGDSRLMRSPLDFAIRANKLLARIVFIEYFPLQIFGLVAMILTVIFMGLASGAILAGAFFFINPLYWSSVLGSFAISIIGYVKINGGLPGLKFEFDEIKMAEKKVQTEYFTHIDGRIFKDTMELSNIRYDIINEGRFY